ncbi:MAG TPA: hypothetical protein VLU25_19530 [Acidobacteriota bacterium]|nr:hypothetical protein [Acidobacteriota bacterium]
MEINRDLLRSAKRILATATIRETIEKALLEVQRGEARREEVEALSSMEGLDLIDPDVMAKAWRS